MKRYQKYLALIGLALLVAACMKILNVNHPETAPVNTGVDVSIDIEVTPKEDGSSRVLVGILAPEKWKLAESSQVTFTTSYGPETMTMRVATDADTAPSGKTWPASLRDSLGTQDNYEPVEWTAFIADDELSWKNKEAFTGSVKIHFTTGEENLKANLAYVVSNVKEAADVDVRVVHKQLFETTGGENATIDYTQPKMCSIVPETFTWEDIVALHCNLSIPVNGEDSPLKGAEKVYLMARATYGGGTNEVIVDEVGPKTLMTKNGTDKWMLYIYPHEFFGIPAGVKIENVSFYMVNEDKSIEVKMPNGEEFSFPENNK